MRADKDKVIIDRDKLEELERGAEGKIIELNNEISTLNSQIDGFISGKKVIIWNAYYDNFLSGPAFGSVSYYGDKDEFMSKIQPALDNAYIKLDEAEQALKRIRKGFWLSWGLAAIFGVLFVLKMTVL